MQLGSFLKIVAVTLAFDGYAARAESAVACPSSLQYSNGQNLKDYDNFYYSSGRTLKYGGSLYHPNGHILKFGNSLYYQNGQYFKYNETYYYQNAQYLKQGENLYHQNGQLFGDGTNFYYQNGRYAKHGSTVYREDGSQTDFPVDLVAPIPTVGELRAELTSDGAEVHLAVWNLVTSSEIRRATLWVESDFSLGKIRIEILTGRPNQFVTLAVDPEGTTTCTLGN